MFREAIKNKFLVADLPSKILEKLKESKKFSYYLNNFI